MKTRNEINKEAREVYFAMKKVSELQGTDYCQSWWINTRNFDLKSKLKTPQINQRAKLLIKGGYLTIDSSRTSTSMGISYKFTDKIL